MTAQAGFGGVPRAPGQQDTRTRRALRRLASAGNLIVDGTSIIVNSLGQLALSPPVSVSNGGTGDTSLTAYAVLCGGTTTTGPVQQVSGVGTSGQVLTSNGPGALPTWQTVSGGVQLVYANTSVPAGNTVTGTTSRTAFASSYTFAANSLQAGQVIRLRAWGVWSTGSTPGNISFAIYLGTTKVCGTINPFQPGGSNSNEPWYIEADITVDTTGAGGTLEAQAWLTSMGPSSSTGYLNPMTNTATVSLDTTQSQALTIQVTPTQTTTSLTLRSLVVEVL